MPVTEVSSAADLAAALKVNKSKLVVVDFYATWCGPCKAIAPHVDRLSSQYAKEAAFLKVDVDKAPDVAKEAGVQAMPSFGFYGEGRLVELMKGADPRGLEERVKKYSAQFFKSPFTSAGYSLSGSSRPASAAAAQPAAPAASAAGGGGAAAGGSGRRNPWADPNFMPGKKSTPAAASATTAAAAPASSTQSTAIPAGSKLLNPAAASSASSSSSSSSTPSSAAPSSASSADKPAPPAATDPASSATAADTAAAPAPATAASSHPSLAVKPELLQQLRDMGFTDVRAQKALLFSGNRSAEDALNWLMEHQEDADIDEPLQVVGVAEKKDDGGLPPGVNLDDLDEDAQVLYAEVQKRKAREQAALSRAAPSSASAAAGASAAGAGAGSGKKAVSDMSSEEKRQWLEDRKAAVKAKKEAESLEKIKTDFKSTKGMTSALNDLKEQREEFERQQAIARRKKEDADKAKQKREIQERLAADKERRRLDQERTMAALEKAKAEKANGGK